MEIVLLLTENRFVKSFPVKPQANPLPQSIRALGSLPSGLIAESEAAIALAKKFNEAFVIPSALKLDLEIEKNSETIPTDLIDQANRAHFFSLWLPKVFGGGGFTPFSMMPFNQELGRACLGVGNIIGAHYMGVSVLSATLNTKILKFLTDEILSGEKNNKPCVFSVAITEPTAGTDLEDADLIERADVRCIAKRVPGGYRLSGTKVFISNAKFATWHVVIAYADAKDPKHSPIIFVVRAGTEGLRVGRSERKMGQHLCQASELHFQDCFIPDKWIALSPEQYRDRKDYLSHCEILIDDILPLSRAGVAAFAAGASQSAFEIATLYTTQEELNGKAMIHHEWVQSVLAEMKKNVSLAEHSYWDTAFSAALSGSFKDFHQPSLFYSLKLLPEAVLSPMLSPALTSRAAINILRKNRLASKNDSRALSASGSLAKIAATDLAMENCRLALDLMGVDGGRHHMGLEKILRDAKLLQIYEGTNQLNRINLFKGAIAPFFPDVRIFE